MTQPRILPPIGYLECWGAQRNEQYNAKYRCAEAIALSLKLYAHVLRVTYVETAWLFCFVVTGFQVYYGFSENFMKWGEENIHHFDDWMADINHLLDQDGVIYKGQPQSSAQHMLRRTLRFDPLDRPPLLTKNGMIKPK